MQTVEVIKMLDDYYGKRLSDNQIRIYLRTLNDLPAELVNMAAEHLIKTGHPFMPKVAEIRRAARQLDVAGKFEHVDPLKLIPGAAQTEADLDERYGTLEENKEICEVFTSGGSLSDRQQAILALGTPGEI